MNKILETVLPKSFKKAKYTKQGYEIEKEGVYGFIEMKDFSTFSEEKNTWFISLGIDMVSNYRIHDDFINHIIFDISIIEKEIHFAEGMLQKVTYFKPEDTQKLATTLHSTVFPWFEKMLQPETLIGFLEASQVVGLDNKEEEYIKKFGDIVLFFKYWSLSQRNSYLDLLATLYEKNEQFDKALICLEKYRPYFEKRIYPSDSQEIKDLKYKVLKQIDESIKNYSQILQ